MLGKKRGANWRPRRSRDRAETGGGLGRQQLERFPPPPPGFLSAVSAKGGMWLAPYFRPARRSRGTPRHAGHPRLRLGPVPAGPRWAKAAPCNAERAERARRPSVPALLAGLPLPVTRRSPSCCWSSREPDPHRGRRDEKRLGGDRPVCPSPGSAPASFGSPRVGSEQPGLELRRQVSLPGRPFMRGAPPPP